MTDSRPLTDWKRLIPVGFFLIALAALSACGSIPDPPRKLETQNVTLMYIDQKTDRDLDGFDLKHPQNISEPVVEAHLRSVYYQSQTLTGSVNRAFSDDQISRLKRLLTKAIKHAKPNHYIYFEVEGEDGPTGGDVFLSRGEINWRMKVIHGTDFSKKKWARVENAWQLVPRKGQHLHTKKLVFEQTIGNWLVSDLKIAENAIRKPARRSNDRTRQPAPSDTRPASPAPAMGKELERKLQILENLRKKELIDESEYEQRRDKLLDSYLE